LINAIHFHFIVLWLHFKSKFNFKESTSFLSGLIDAYGGGGSTSFLCGLIDAYGGGDALVQA
jgi:hypothetical protein